MIGPFSIRRAVRLRKALPLLWVVPVAGCDGGEQLASAETPLAPIDSLVPPGDSVPVAPGPDSLVAPVPGPDSSTPSPSPDPVAPPPPPPPDPVAPGPTPPVPPPEHVGIPFGAYHVPPVLYGTAHSATLLAAHPWTVIRDLEAARRASTRVVLSLVGSERRVRGADGHFSLAVWKQRVDRFRGIDFSPYIQDGTIVAHYVMDEPHDASNWNGKLVSRSEVDEMAKYSKQLWPTLPTVIRGWPDYLKGHNYQYLDAAWAQYSDRFGDLSAFINDNVRDAKAAGLGLVVGLNLLGGGNRSGGLKDYSRDRYAMTASQVRSWGSALLAEPYACAFISWEYNDRYYDRADIKSALEELNQKARSRPRKACTK